MNIVQLARCAFGQHERDRSTVITSGTSWYRGRCKGCGVPMVKGPEGWRLERKDVA
ncbi:MAG TPA: hypothetical protein VLG14_11105 [Sphingomonas sp.]|nr:hypothetical protein [Sphingomonas sp.]